MSKLLITKYHNQLHEILSAGGTRNETSITFAFAGLLRSYYQNVSRSAVVLSKRLLYQMDGMTFDTALASGVDINTIARLTDDCQNRIAKFLNK